MARNRIIYASQSVWCNGEVLYRVQSLGSTTTFTSEDIFELGHLDIIDVVDDVPAVAVTLNTNDFGDVRTLAVLAQLAPAKLDMDATADADNANLVVVSGTDYTETSDFLHGVSLADFAVVCGNLPGVTLWAPVQDECSLGTLADNIDQCLFLDELFVNSLEFGYTTGANATENYGAECDNKMWLLNAGRFVNFEDFAGAEFAAGDSDMVDLTLASGNNVATLTGGIGFLRKDYNGAPAVTVYDVSENEVTNYEIEAGDAAVVGKFRYSASGPDPFHRVLKPTDLTLAADDLVEVVYAADAYGSATTSKYFTSLSSADRPDSMGALRQGQVEVYIVDPNNDLAYDIAWRLTGCTITSDLTREALAELGHLGPYDRPLTLPIPITVTVDSTAGDLENWSKVAGKLDEFKADSVYDLDLADLMAEEDLRLVAMVYGQTDEEAGGTGANRKIAAGSPFIDQHYWVDGTMGTYSASDTEYPLKTIYVEHLKITDEGATLDMGANMTQTFGFRSTNDLYVIKGYVSIEHITGDFTIRRN
jgi:hypothetical protein